MLLPVAVLTLTGCSAMNSLIFHPLHVVHEEHENQEQEEKAYKKIGEEQAKEWASESTNRVTNPR